MESTLDPITAAAVLSWQIDLGLSDAVCDAPINRYDLGSKPALTLPEVAKNTHWPNQKADNSPLAHRAGEAVGTTANVGVAAVSQVSAREEEAAAAQAQKEQLLAQAKTVSAAAQSLSDLRAVLFGFEGCDLKRGARAAVFADGVLGAKVMVITQAPSRAEESQARSFVDAEGLLFERMFDAIGLSRDALNPEEGLYIVPALPWRTPQDRAPSAEELALLTPFVVRHIALAAPKLLVLMGHSPCEMLLGQGNVSRIRGRFTTYQDIKVLPMVHPTQLLRNPDLKRDSWADLLALKAALLGN